MKNRLMSLNIGMTIQYEDAKGDEQTYQVTGLYPSKAFPQVFWLFVKLFDELNRILGTALYVSDHSIEPSPVEYELLDEVDTGSSG